MKFYPVKTPKIIQNAFRSFIWSVPVDNNSSDPSCREIYLTFDDGPIPEITPWVLQTLSNFKAKATFFCIGKNVENHSNIFQKIIDEGHSIGNHTFNHLNGWKTNTQKYVNNVDKAETSFQSKTTTKLFRPPYGKIKPSQAKKIIDKGYKIIMWSVLSGDFDQKLSKEDCFKNTVKNAKKGSIIVFHDSEKAFKNLQYTLPKTLQYFTDKGYEFKSL